MTRHLLLPLLLCGTALAAAAPDVRLPEPAAVPQPMPPAPAPGGSVRLGPDMLYVVDSDDPVLVFAGPKGLVRVTRETGPLKIRGRFAGGSGFTETKTFKGPHLAILEPVASGTVELLVVPAGAKSEADAIVRTVEVEAGDGPRPPPKPPEPGPTPKPPEPKPAAVFKVVLVYESGDTLTAAQNAVLYGKVVEEYLTNRCTGGKLGWGRRDKDADPAADTTGLKDLWAAVKPKVTSTPCLAVAVDNAVTLEPLPATPAEAVALLEKYRTGGGK